MSEELSLKWFQLYPSLAEQPEEKRNNPNCYGLTFRHWCPGCEFSHMVPVERNPWNGHVWSWNGDPNQPAISPSMNIVGRCHYFLRRGSGGSEDPELSYIQFLSDSKHKLSGQTVLLPDFPEDERDKESAVKVNTHTT